MDFPKLRIEPINVVIVFENKGKVCRTYNVQIIFLINYFGNVILNFSKRKFYY